MNSGTIKISSPPGHRVWLFTSIQARAGGKGLRLDAGYGSITFKGRDFTFRMSYTKDYDTPDEKLSYSELKDRIREECARVLPRKERILLAAKKLEDDLTLKDTICDQICSDLGDVTSERYIRKCLPDEYKQQKKRRKQSTSDLRNRSANDDKNVPEKKAMAVDASTGYEEPFKDIDRPNIESASEIEKTYKRSGRMFLRTLTK